MELYLDEEGVSDRVLAARLLRFVRAPPFTGRTERSDISDGNGLPWAKGRPCLTVARIGAENRLDFWEYHMKTVVNIVLCAGLGTGFASASGDSVECEYRGYVAPIGISPYQIHCRDQDGRESSGFITSPPKLNHIKVELRNADGVFVMEVTLSNPPQEIPAPLGWIEEQVKEKGIHGFSEDYKVYPARWGYGFDGTTILYEDPSAVSSRGTVAGMPGDDDTAGKKPDVQWIAPPMIVNTPSGPSIRICVGRISANTRFSKEVLELPGYFRTNSYCRAIGPRTCPPPRQCLMDQSLPIRTAIDPEGFDVEERYPEDRTLK